MIPSPTLLSILFMIITCLASLIFCKATKNSLITLVIISFWTAFQAAIAILDFYKVTYTAPPRQLLLVLPPLLFIIAMFFTTKGRTFIDSLDLKTLTILHTIRIGVEIVLYFLFIYKLVPQIMTFEGRNFDILAGLTAPVVYYFGFIKNRLNRIVILIWNFLCLGLLLNIVVIAMLSVPFPLQQFAFEQPNIGVLSFPYNWLPSVVVPIVLFAHLASIRQILMMGKLKTETIS